MQRSSASSAVLRPSSETSLEYLITLKDDASESIVSILSFDNQSASSAGSEFFDSEGRVVVGLGWGLVVMVGKENKTTLIVRIRSVSKYFEQIQPFLHV